MSSNIDEKIHKKGDQDLVLEPIAQTYIYKPNRLTIQYIISDDFKCVPKNLKES